MSMCMLHALRPVYNIQTAARGRKLSSEILLWTQKFLFCLLSRA